LFSKVSVVPFGDIGLISAGLTDLSVMPVAPTDYAVSSSSDGREGPNPAISRPKEPLTLKRRRTRVEVRHMETIGYQAKREVNVKARIFRVGSALATLGALVAASGAANKWH